MAVVKRDWIWVKRDWVSFVMFSGRGALSLRILGGLILLGFCFFHEVCWWGELPLEGEDTAVCVSFDLLCFCLLDKVLHVHDLKE